MADPIREISIRHYQPGDQRLVYQIAADTAFFGDPVEAYLDDRRLFCDAFVGFYTAHKAEYAWVAEHDGEVIGYLLGSNQYITRSNHWLPYMFKSVVLPVLSRKYKIGRITVRFAYRMVGGYLKKEEPPVDLAIYPAHLHVNIDKQFRGYGVGGRLIEAYLEQLYSQRIYGVYLHTTSHNEAACHLYEKLGFQLLGSHASRFWSEWFGFRVDNRSYGLKLV